MEPALGDLVISGGRVLDASGERAADVRVRDGRVVEVGPGLRGDDTLDAGGCLVTPGLVDVHVHLREPGMEDAETIETGARAAALGGFTAIVAMPNTTPPLDDPSVVAAVLAAGERSLCEVVSSGCITKGRQGRELAPMGELYRLGVRMFTDDGDCVADAGVMRRALDYSRALPGAVISQHAEDPDLVGNGAMHEGEWSSRLGIPGRPRAAEEVVVARDLILARTTGARIHFQHVSTAGAVAMVRAAKAAGIPVTAEACPHHFTLTDACCASFDPVFKVNPPLRTDDDLAAIKAGLADGTIDVVATDHAPHPTDAKERPFEQAPSGMLGLETALALVWDELVLPGVLTPGRAFAACSWNGAAIAGLADHGGPIVPDAVANLCVFDPGQRWEVDADRLASKARNTPYAGRALSGKVRHTVLRGVPVVRDGEAQG
ncbi:MAG: dihydroorotase [Actinomycetota bacterium]